MRDEYRFHPLELSEAELQVTSDLLRHVFTRARYLTPGYLRWQYVENPDGRAIGYNAHLGGKLVGHSAALPLRARMGADAHPGVLLVNTAVHPGHLRRNISRRITEGMFEAASRQGYAFALAVGNAHSTVPLLTRFEIVAPLHAKIGIGAPRGRSPDSTPGFERTWSEEALRWRLSNPERRYTVQAREGELTVLAPTGRPGVGALLYQGANRWGLPGSGGGSRGPLRVWLGLDPGIDWKRSRFLDVPRMLRASPLNLVFRDLRGGSLHPDPARVVFRAIDFDPF